MWTQVVKGFHPRVANVVPFSTPAPLILTTALVQRWSWEVVTLSRFPFIKVEQKHVWGSPSSIQHTVITAGLEIMLFDQLIQATTDQFWQNQTHLTGRGNVAVNHLVWPNLATPSQEQKWWMEVLRSRNRYAGILVCNTQCIPLTFEFPATKLWFPSWTILWTAIFWEKQQYFYPPKDLFLAAQQNPNLFFYKKEITVKGLSLSITTRGSIAHLPTLQRNPNATEWKCFMELPLII